MSVTTPDVTTAWQFGMAFGIAAVHLLALPLAVLFVVAGFTVLPAHWLTSREGDRNGLSGGIINVVLCALAGYGVLTWVRNISLRSGVR